MRKPSKGIKRWYDQNPDIAKAFTSIQSMPEEYQHLVGNVVIALCNRIKSQRIQNGELLKVGAERALGLLKSQSKRRIYDRDKVLHKAFNKLYLLEDKQRGYLAKRLCDGIFYMEEYVLACDRVRKLPEMREVIYIFKLGIEEGPAAGEDYLQGLGLWHADHAGEHLKQFEAQATNEAFRENLPVPKPPRKRAWLIEEKGSLGISYQG